MPTRTRSTKPSAKTVPVQTIPAATPASSVSYPASQNAPQSTKQRSKFRRVLSIYMHSPFRMIRKVSSRRKKVNVAPATQAAAQPRKSGFFGKLAHGLMLMALTFLFIILTLRVEKEFRVSDRLISTADRIGEFFGIRIKTTSQPTPAEMVSNLRKKASQDLIVEELLAHKAKGDAIDRQILVLQKAVEENWNLQQEQVVKFARSLAVTQNDVKELKKELGNIDSGISDLVSTTKSRIESVEQRLDEINSVSKEDIVIAVKNAFEENRKEGSKPLNGQAPSIRIATQPAADIVNVDLPVVNPQGEPVLVPIGKETRRYSRSEILNKRISWDSYTGVDFYGQKKDGSWVKLEAPLDGPTLANIHYVKMSSKTRPFYVSEKPQGRYSLN